jgi:hypothetical protein
VLADYRRRHEEVLNSLEEASESVRRCGGHPIDDVFDEIEAEIDAMEEFSRDRETLRRSVG